MADFVPAFEFLLPHEGGYVNDDDDPGGETKYGITKRTYPDLDIKNLTVAEAASIYLRDWWSKYPFSGIGSQQIANKVFDLAVNMGTQQAFLLTQRACCDVGQPVICDGKLGVITLKAINSCDQDQLLEAIRNQAVEFYTDLEAKRPTNSKFLAGWLKRARA